MQILFGVNETIIKINSKSLKIGYIQGFINEHFLNTIVSDNSIFIPQVTKRNHHRTFLLKWLYSLYVKKTKNYIQDLKSTLLKRENKAIKILFCKDIAYNTSYKNIYDKESIKECFKETKPKVRVINHIDRAYLTLGLSQSDDVKTLKRRYKKLAMEYHPDKVAIKDDDTITFYTQKFQGILQAYELLLKRSSTINYDGLTR